MPAPAKIYLDNAATTRPLPAVVDAMAAIHLDAFGNPSSSHGFADAPSRALQDARDFLRGTLSAAQLIFTSGGTESDLIGITGAAMVRSPGRILVAQSDHPAALNQATLLQKLGHRLTLLPVTEHGDIDPETLFEYLGKDARVVSLLHGHNELGTLSRLEEQVSLVRQVAPRAHIHVDLVQAYGKVPFDLDEADVDSVAVSAHKLHGPRGVGFLALSSKADLGALQNGGGQEEGLRGGTENVAGAVGLATAAESAFTHMALNASHCEDLAAQLFERIREVAPNAQRLGHPSRRLPHILSVRLPGYSAASLLQQMSAEGVAFSTGSACHGAGDQDNDNHVLKAIGLSRRAAGEVVRLSFCPDNTPAEVDTVADLMDEVMHHLQRLAPKRRTKPAARST